MALSKAFSSSSSGFSSLNAVLLMVSESSPRTGLGQYHDISPFTIMILLIKFLLWCQ